MVSDGCHHIHCRKCSLYAGPKGGLCGCWDCGTFNRWAIPGYVGPSDEGTGRGDYVDAEGRSEDKGKGKEQYGLGKDTGKYDLGKGKWHYDLGTDDGGDVHDRGKGKSSGSADENMGRGPMVIGASWAQQKGMVKGKWCRGYFFPFSPFYVGDDYEWGYLGSGQQGVVTDV